MDVSWVADTVTPVHRVLMDGVDPGAMVESVRGGMLEHTQLAPGQFRGHVLRARDGEFCVDWGRYNLPVLA